MQHRLFGLRGKAYIAEYKKLFAELHQPLIKDFQEMSSEQGRFTPIHLGQLALKHRLPLKVLDEFLADYPEISYPAGTWERLQSRGLKARDIGVVWN